MRFNPFEFGTRKNYVYLAVFQFFFFFEKLQITIILWNYCQVLISTKTSNPTCNITNNVQYRQSTLYRFCLQPSKGTLIALIYIFIVFFWFLVSNRGTWYIFYAESDFARVFASTYSFREKNGFYIENKYKMFIIHIKTFWQTCSFPILLSTTIPTLKGFCVKYFL